MATQRKVKKLADGFDKGDFEGVDEAVARNAAAGDMGEFAGLDEAVARNAGSASSREASADEAMAANKSAPTFKEAFAAARQAGDKTFSWNGKSFTTELAGEKKAAPRGIENARDALLMRKRDLGGTQNARDALLMRQAKSNVRQEIKDREEANRAARSRALPLRSTASESGYTGMGSLKFAKGGATASKRADGIAQRGKTRGTIVACGGGSMKGKK